MQPQDSDSNLPAIKVHFPSPPRHQISSAAPAGSPRKIGVAVDLSDESPHTVRWAVKQYLRPGDSVVLLHVSPTSVLFGADWGPLPATADDPNPEYLQKSQEEFDAFTSSKAIDLAKPLSDAQIPYKIHIVKDHDMKERLCLEVERLGLSAVIIGSRGFGAARRGRHGRLGSVSDYCVHHCICPVVVVRYPDDKESGDPLAAVNQVIVKEEEEEEKAVLALLAGAQQHNKDVQL